MADGRRGRPAAQALHLGSRRWLAGAAVVPRRTGPGSAARTGCGGAPPDRHRGTDAGHGFSLSPDAEVDSSGFASHARDRV
jgi:hypothetical protein